MSAWQVAVLLIGTGALFLSASMHLDAKHQMWTLPKMRAERWSLLWLLVGGWCIGIVWFTR